MAVHLVTATSMFRTATQSPGAEGTNTRMMPQNNAIDSLGNTQHQYHWHRRSLTLENRYRTFIIFQDREVSDDEEVITFGYITERICPYRLTTFFTDVRRNCKS